MPAAPMTDSGSGLGGVRPKAHMPAQTSRKATAVRMYDKVQAHWTAEIARLKATLGPGGASLNGDDRERLLARIHLMETTNKMPNRSRKQNTKVTIRSSTRCRRPGRHGVQVDSLQWAQHCSSDEQGLSTAPLAPRLLRADGGAVANSAAEVINV